MRPRDFYGVTDSSVAKPAGNENLVEIESTPGIQYHPQLLLSLNIPTYHNKTNTRKSTSYCLIPYNDSNHSIKSYMLGFQSLPGSGPIMYPLFQRMQKLCPPIQSDKILNRYTLI